MSKMEKWAWLTKPGEVYDWPFALRVIGKAALLFVVLNVLFALLNPLPLLGRISIYNTLVPGRQRLPYGDNPAQSYNLSLNSLDAMFASHEITRPKADDEYRVLLLGDSATWGFLLRPDETLAGVLDARGYTTADGRQLRVYNLGYPIMSLTKDLLLLDYAMRYDPDLIVWLVTLESFPRDKQLSPPLVQNNAAATRRLIDVYGLDLDRHDARLVDPDFWQHTLVGQRRALADLVRLQLYGFSWAATGIDQHYPASYDLRQEDFEEDLSWKGGGFEEPHTLTEADLAFDVLQAGITLAGETPLLLINEPMFISAGQNSDLRYNFFYPRWAYDDYQALLTRLAADRDWLLLDLWDVIDPGEFTDSAVHFTPLGANQLGDLVGPALVTLANEGDLPVFMRLSGR